MFARSGRPHKFVPPDHHRWRGFFRTLRLGGGPFCPIGGGLGRLGMAWLPIDFDTPDKKEVVALSSRLKRDVAECFGRVVMVWIWVQKNTPDGRIPNGTLEMIDHAAKLEGFGKAMLEVEWCSFDGAQLVFPRWDRYNEQNAKKRMQNAERQRKVREKAPPPPVAPLSRPERDGCSGGGGIPVLPEGGPGETDPLVRRKLELLDEYGVKSPDREVIAHDAKVKPTALRAAWKEVTADKSVRSKVAVLVHRMKSDTTKPQNAAASI